jgi:hypothetical protein
MKRQHQWLLIGSTLALSWLAMQIVHELGHVLAAWVTGGRLAKVLLHPLAISHTLLSANPSPVVVARMGPLVGVLAPLLAWLVASRMRVRGDFIWKFFAGFCLVANGAYLAGGSLCEMGDAADLIRYDTPRWLLWLFGALTIPSGLLIWNGLGQHFGLLDNFENIDRTVAYFVTATLACVILLELLLARS